jgi:hypothetical protein
MDNNYFTQVSPFMQQDQGGLTPVFQNIGAQQALQNQLMQQQLQQNQAASNIGSGMGKGMGGLSPLAMASMLRGQGGASIGDRAANYFGTQQSPEMKAEISQLGSNTWNPISNYYTGKNGWGSYGE